MAKLKKMFSIPPETHEKIVKLGGKYNLNNSEVIELAVNALDGMNENLVKKALKIKEGE